MSEGKVGSSTHGRQQHLTRLLQHTIWMQELVSNASAASPPQPQVILRKLFEKLGVCGGQGPGSWAPVGWAEAWRWGPHCMPQGRVSLIHASGRITFTFTFTLTRAQGTT